MAAPSPDDPRERDDPDGPNGPIELAADPTIPIPPLPGTVLAADTAERLHERLAADLIAQALNCVHRFGDYHLALSGGSTPMPFYERLMTDPNYRLMPWRRTHLWIVDERRVPFEDEKSNYRHIHEIIAEHADIPAAQVHPIPAMEEDAAAQYERALRESLGWRERGQDRLDFVLLGMGDNGHTASLFPMTRVLDERERWVGLCDGPTVTPPPRVTMTYPLINAARFVGVLVVGANKAEMISRVARGKEDYHELPIKGIQPLAGELRWYLDRAACGDSTPIDPGAHPGGPRTHAPRRDEQGAPRPNEPGSPR
ncbi:MAG: 6-phosphogluconolactonase [Phycisphaerae bacterium]|nr:6-phosphogluconolactonase [Phycisphaerae bacterium]